MTSVRLGAFLLDRDRGELLTSDGEQAPLRRQALLVLLTLAERAGHVVGKEELIGAVWPGKIVTDDSLTQAVADIRRLLGPDGPTLLRTVPRRGYLLKTPPAEPDDLRTAASGPSAPTAHRASRAAGNLPSRRPSLIGRDVEQSKLVALLVDQPLVTLVGAGGMGKTVLGLAAACEAADGFPDGAWCIELARLTDPSALVAVVAQTLHISLGLENTADQLVSVLALQSMLLLLDNCEHLVPSVAALSELIGDRCPGVRILVTSQRPLKVRHETLFTVDPLRCPESGHFVDVANFDAVRLFTARARAVQPSFAVTPLNADAVAEICRRLDGMPLAIELAAARVRLIGMSALRARLDERFEVLTGGSRSSLSRHRTLATTIEWSASLLTEPERRLLCRLGVFVGGFSLELSQAVGGDEELQGWDFLNALDSLVEVSLVQVDADDPPRYGMLESTRAYALERLEERGEADSVRRRHAAAVRDVLVEADRQWLGDDGRLTTQQYMRRLAVEVDNVRSAFHWSFEVAHDADAAVGLVTNGVAVVRWTGLSREWLGRLLSLRTFVERESNDATKARFWWAVSHLGDTGMMSADELREAECRSVEMHRAMGGRRRLYLAMYHQAAQHARLAQFDESAAILDEMRRIESATDPPWLRASRLNLAGMAELLQGRAGEALILHREQEELLRGFPGEAVHMIVCGNNLACTLNALGRFDEAAASAQSVIALGNRERNSDVDYAKWQLLHSLSSSGRADEAQALMREAMKEWRRHASVLMCASFLARVLAESGHLWDAARVDGAALAHARRSGARPNLVRQHAHARTQELLERGGVDLWQVQAWREEGESLDEEGVAVLCLSASRVRAVGPSSPPRPTPTNLPVALPRLFGRAADTFALGALVEAHRLVTVAGPGGIGKTVLARSVAHASRDRFDDGAWLVEFAAVSDPELVVSMVAATVGVRLGNDATAEDLANALGSAALLLVLDNCEHLLASIARLAAALHRGAPRVHLLATSVEPLRLAEERLYRLGALEIPLQEGAEAARRTGAIALFEARARAADPRFRLDDGNCAAVIDICRRLDGIPLAIEMAAARVRLLGVDGLASRLDERFHVLTHGYRLALRRHETLRAALDWSHALLSASEQAVFRRLGVLAASFTLESAQLVAVDDTLDKWAVLDCLGMLVDKSIVVVDAAPAARYRLLETNRAYALERLAEADEIDRCMDVLARGTLALFEASRRDEYRLTAMDLLDRYIVEIDNARAVLDWSAGSNPQLNVALAGAMAWIWTEAGLRPEGLHRTSVALGLLGPGALPGHEARLRIAWAALRYPDLGPEEMAHSAQAVRLCRQADDSRALFVALCQQVRALALGHRLDLAAQAIEEASGLLDPGWPPLLQALLLRMRAWLHWRAGRFSEALATAEQAVQMARALGDQRVELRTLILAEQSAAGLRRWDEAVARGQNMLERMHDDRLLRSGLENIVLSNLVMSLTHAGRVVEALRVAREARMPARRAGRTAELLDPYAMLAFRRGRGRAAACILGCADGHFAGHASRHRDPAEQTIHDELQILLKETMSPDELAAAMAEGEAMGLDDALELAVED